MNTRIEELLQRIRALDKELSEELERDLEVIRRHLDYTIEQGRVRFRQGALAAQRRLRIGLFRYLREANLLFIVTSPVIYALIFPLALLDLFLTVYQHVCFPLYRIPKVRRSDHIIIDRHHLGYLNLVEKLNCVYCGYGNGLLAYGLEIASRTEAYWCPIKHARRPRDPHFRYQQFAEYGDAAAYRQRQRDTRRQEADQP